MNILITSAGIRGYIIKYFKQSLKNQGKIYAADCSRYAPALYDADSFFILPEVTNKNYINELINHCKKYDIKGIISLNDIELPILADNKKKFEKEKIKIIISDPEVIDICYDKYKTYQFLTKNGFKSPKTYISLKKAEEDFKKRNIKLPLLVKPRRGSASIDIVKVNTLKELKNEFSKKKNLIIQEYIDGVEYGIDVFNNEEKTPVTVFAKKKIKMRAGETDKAMTIYDEKLLKQVSKLSKKIGLFGPGDIDVFKHKDNYVFMEINPRFGGGYPLSHSIGADFPKKIIDILMNRELKPSFTRYPENIVMMKQYEIVTKNIGNNER